MSDSTRLPSPALSRYGDEWDIGLAIKFLRQNAVALLISVLFASALGYGTSYLIKPRYRSEAVLVYSSDLSPSQSGGMASQLGSLGALVGLSSGDDRQKEALATLKSRTILESYIQEQNLLPVLYESKWDAQNNRWKPTDSQDIPDTFDGYKLFDKRIRAIFEDKKNNTITISVTWTDRETAARWIRDIVARTNEHLRNAEIRRSSQNILYLNEQAAKTQIVEVKNSIYKLLELEIKKVMIANVSTDYAFRFIDNPSASRKKVAPSRFLFAAGFGVLALVVTTLALLVRGARINNKEQ